LLTFWGWIREINGFLGMLWQSIERFFEPVQQKKSRKYASRNAERLDGYPVEARNMGAAPVWTAYGRGGRDQQITMMYLVLALAGVGIPAVPDRACFGGLPGTFW
jgi:hypothetical protein